MKRTLALLLILAVIVSACVIIPVTSSAEALPMYVITQGNRKLQVRSSPETHAKNVIGKLSRGDKVMVEFINSSGWAVILYKNKEAYVQARYLSDKKPSPDTTPAPKPDDSKAKEEQEKLNKELESEKEVDPFYVASRPNRASGWVNFRVGPSTSTSRIYTLPANRELIVIGETNNWYRARDPETGKIGYVAKEYTTRLTKQVSVPTSDGVQKLGRLSVNGEFDITCKLPEGYNVQVINQLGNSIIASVTSDDMTKPQLFLSIAFDEAYADVERMNDMTDEDLQALEATFFAENDVVITYALTGLGTKLLIAREIGTDTDFVDILSVYKGYFVEFNMTPNPKAANQVLTEDQIRMCIDFLTNVDFIPAK